MRQVEFALLTLVGLLRVGLRLRKVADERRVRLSKCLESLAVAGRLCASKVLVELQMLLVDHGKLLRDLVDGVGV